MVGVVSATIVLNVAVLLLYISFHHRLCIVLGHACVWLGLYMYCMCVYSFLISHVQVSYFV